MLEKHMDLTQMLEDIGILNERGTDLAISVWTYLVWRVRNIGNNKGD